MDRRTFLYVAAGLSLGPVSGKFSAQAQTAWPSQSVTIVVPFAPGGQADLAARPLALGLTKLLGQSVVVDNRAGAGGAIGAAAVLKADPDGHTMLMALSAIAVLPEAERVSGRKPTYEMSQFTPIARVLGDPNLLIVSAVSPYKTVKDLVDDAKQRPGQIAYASAGNFGASHLCMEMFCSAADIKLLHVPYRGGGPALAGLLGGQVVTTAQGAGPLKGYSDEGKLRVLATFGTERHPAFPDAPTFLEAGYNDVIFYVWAGLFVPRAVPAGVVTRLRQAVGAVMDDPQTIKIFNNAGSPPAYLDATEFAAYIETDSKRLIAAVQKIGKLD
jgi:tripartite-type tricarboxylate transporter receptor subunit TctC